MNSDAHTVLVTGAGGFIGRNLVAALGRRSDLIVRAHGRHDGSLEAACDGADVIVHLAGANRPADPTEFTAVNLGTTLDIVRALEAGCRNVPVLFASSTQAASDNAYGLSKRRAEDVLRSYGARSGAQIEILRLPNVFGKWSRPFYNSVVATFCHNATRGLPLVVDSPDRLLQLLHVDELVRYVEQWVLAAAQDPSRAPTLKLGVAHEISVGDLANLVLEYAASRRSRMIPDLSTTFARALYGTMASFYEVTDLAVPATVHSDARGWLFEVVKSRSAGQVFMSSTRPGATRGEHWHDTKVERFTVVQGTGSILFRLAGSDEVVVHPVTGSDIVSVDIPTGYVHAIRNDGDEDLLVLFWASEVLDPERPDTHYERVVDGDAASR